jgi:sodium borate transporter 11
VFKAAPLDLLPWDGVLLGMGLGFCLSLLFFMDQNISQSMVNSPDNKYVTSACILS